MDILRALRGGRDTHIHRLPVADGKGEDNMNLQNAKDLINQVTGISIGLAFLMILLGFLAIGLPLATGIGIALLVGWIVIFSGFAHLAYAFAAQGPGAFLWRLLIG
ncbi:MAG TPA: DUF308 domain-containing protein, partial [Candidatus Manganitrophaceae bacterium]|nr:DUF308 domain-containing protein [Candidatus Manganitrophaceae bacterium]